MKAKLTLTVDRNTLARARRKLKSRGRSISAEVDSLLARIANEQTTSRPLWSELFGDIRIPLDMKEAESDSWYGKHLRRTAAYRDAKAAERKKDGK